MDSMTSRQRGQQTREKIKAYITSYRLQHDGLSPSLQEIGDGVGLASHNAVRSQLLTMKADGEVTWEEGRYRTVRVLDPTAP